MSKRSSLQTVKTFKLYVVDTVQEKSSEYYICETLGLYKLLSSYILSFIFRSRSLPVKDKPTKPYLKTTTSKQVENTKAFEITIIKELGKLTP